MTCGRVFKQALEEEIQFHKDDGVTFHLIARPRIVTLVVVRHLFAPEELDRSHQVFQENIADAKS